MNTTINWLHLTDWHFGQSGQKHLWPNLRAEFQRDISELIAKHGHIDLIFFTGDLVQSGERSQYQQLEAELNALLPALGPNTQIITIPGNHDLNRPDPSKASVLALSNWERQVEVRETFWNKPKSDLRKCVSKCFEEYERWRSKTRLPLCPSHKGLLPGDLATTYIKDDCRLGIIGFNTTFLQISKGDYEGRLALSARQFDDMCGSNYADWINSHHFCVLLTHHPKSWLCKQSQVEFASDIGIPGRFRIHLSGHLHKSSIQMESHGGSPTSLSSQGASLFGLEFFGEEKEQMRTHGYTFGQWQVTDAVVGERLWPRIAMPKQSGALGLVPDPTAYLEADEAIHAEFKPRMIVDGTNEQSQPKSTKRPPSDLLPVEKSLSSADAEKQIIRVLRFSQTAQLHHLSIRNEERQRLALALKEKRSCSLIADWGTGKDGFIASVVRSIGTSDDEGLAFEDRVFQLRCDNSEQVSDIEHAFLAQFGLSMDEFLRSLASLGPCCLLLDGLQPALNHEREQFVRLIELILDFAPNLSLILIGRTEITSGFPSVEIVPLDLPDLRAYVQSHPDSQPNLLREDLLERLFDASGGLPVHIDRILGRLRVASFDAVLDEETALVQVSTAELPLQKALEQAIKSVSKRDEEYGSRAISLLQSLAMLPYGETIEQLKYFLANEPFYPRDAELLDKASLIEIIPLYQASPLVSAGRLTSHGLGSPKLLRVPKQVRDCVLNSLTNEVKQKLLTAAGEFYFGKTWRTGKKPKLRKTPSEYREYIAHGVGNEYAALQMMIAHAKDAHDELNLNAMARLALHYCGVLKATARNRDLRVATHGLLRLFENTGMDDDLCVLNRLAGRACRMTGHYDEAVDCFRKCLEGEAGKSSRDDRTNDLLQLTEALRKNNNIDDALDSAQKAKALAAIGSESESAAQHNLLSLQPNTPERLASYIESEKSARSKKWVSHANDLSMDIFFDSNDAAQKLKYVNRVLESDDTGWNRHRAVTHKASFLLDNGKASDLSHRDRLDLAIAYSYSHTQRLSMFQRCHEALWSILEQEQNYEDLYRLFRHSSFLWRIRGQDDIELHYFERLKSVRDRSDGAEPAALLVEIQYFLKRANVLLAKISGPQARSAS